MAQVSVKMIRRASCSMLHSLMTTDNVMISMPVTFIHITGYMLLGAGCVPQTPVPMTCSAAHGTPLRPQVSNAWLRDQWQTLPLPPSRQCNLPVSDLHLPEPVQHKQVTSCMAFLVRRYAECLTAHQSSTAKKGRRSSCPAATLPLSSCSSICHPAPSPASINSTKASKSGSWLQYSRNSPMLS